MKTFDTPMGQLKVEVFGHASVRFGIGGKTIYADPYSEVHDYTGEAPADLILITHNHYDHNDPKAIAPIATPRTAFVVSLNVGREDNRYTVLANDAICTWEGIDICAVEAYNVNRRNPAGELFHPRGVGNGYLTNVRRSYPSRLFHLPEHLATALRSVQVRLGGAAPDLF